jgi:dTMP kinase
VGEPRTGEFVVIDGLDASGKSTQAEMLVRYLRGLGKTSLLRTHPSDDNFFGVKSREYLYLKGKKAHIAAALFYMVDVIRSVVLYSWRRVDYVVFVRYLMGTAYLPDPLHKLGYYFFAKIMPKPGRMFYLNVSPGEAFRRITTSRERRERFEKRSELVKIGSKALELARQKPWIVLNGDSRASAIHDEIKSLMGFV